MRDDLQRAFEAILLVAVKPVQTATVAELLEISEAEVEELASALQQRCRDEQRGFELGKHWPSSGNRTSVSLPSGFSAERAAYRSWT